MTERIDRPNDELQPQARVTAKSAGEAAVSPVSRARESSPLNRDIYYDWMDFHNIPELLREW
jgi:hypothetical protein